MKYFRIWCEYEERPELNEYFVYACMDEEAGKKYFEKCFSDVTVEEIKALPETEMRFIPLFNLCHGMYAIRKDMFGRWQAEDFEGVENHAKMAV